MFSVDEPLAERSQEGSAASSNVSSITSEDFGSRCRRVHFGPFALVVASDRADLSGRRSRARAALRPLFAEQSHLRAAFRTFSDSFIAGDEQSARVVQTVRALAASAFRTKTPLKSPIIARH